MQNLWWIQAIVVLAVLTPGALAHAEETIDLDVRADMTVVAQAHVRADADVTYEWDWGDGETSVGARATHRYRDAGEYDVRLKATRDGGRCWAEERVVVIEATRSRGDADDAPRRAESQARARVGGVSADVSVAWVAREDARDEGREHEARAGGRVRASSHDRHDVPAPALPLLLGGLAGATGLRRR